MNETKSINIVDYGDVTVFLRILLENDCKNVRIESEKIFSSSRGVFYRTYRVSWEQAK